MFTTNNNNSNNTNNTIKVLGQSIKVVDHEGLTINEVIGNVSTQNDELSMALVTITQPTSEPWLTIQFDEWMVVTEGCIELHHLEEEVINAETGSPITTKQVVTKVNAGQTAFIPKGSRFRPIFPIAPTKYIPVAMPAFKPERCTREEEETERSVSERLDELHNNNTANQNEEDITTTKPLAEAKSLSGEEINQQFNDITTIYHMCQTSLYNTALQSNKAYYPPTFIQDGRFTHATAIPSTLLTTANHFYKATTKGGEEWSCIELDRTILEEQCGIITIFESAKAVGNVDILDKSKVFPHVFGGLPLHIEGVVKKVYKMIRDEDDGSFLSIEGLC